MLHRFYLYSVFALSGVSLCSTLVVTTLHAAEQSVECSICLENITNQNEVGALGCTHTFHKKCIAAIDNEGEKTCPLCTIKHFGPLLSPEELAIALSRKDELEHKRTRSRQTAQEKEDIKKALGASCALQLQEERTRKAHLEEEAQLQEALRLIAQDASIRQAPLLPLQRGRAYPVIEGSEDADDLQKKIDAIDAEYARQNAAAAALPNHVEQITQPTAQQQQSYLQAAARAIVMGSWTVTKTVICMPWNILKFLIMSL